MSEFLATMVLQGNFAGKKYIYSGAIRELNGKGILVRLDDLDVLEHSVVVPEGPLDQIDRILLYLHRRMEAADSFAEMDSKYDYPIAYAKNPDEFAFLREQARKLGFLETHPNNLESARLAIEGWKHLSELREKPMESDQAFVAMWFDSDLNAAYTEGFQRALDQTGYKPVRLDLTEHNEKICDLILAEIRKSGLLIADFTGQRGGVYFEAGFALGLGIPVIWTCRDTDIDHLHFDTRQYNHIVWKDPSDLREKLTRRIEAICRGIKRTT
jgi:nucleoside 2-deoxyribosyltransferase